MRKVFTTLFRVVVFILSMAFSAQGANDLLLMPSEKIDNVRSSVFMDVANVNGRLVAVGEWGRIVYSEDDGATWMQADVPVSVTLTAVCFPTEHEGWAVGHESVVLNTKDGGKTWEKQIDGVKINNLMIEQLKALIQAKSGELEIIERQADEIRAEKLSLELENLGFFLSDMQMAVEEGPTRPLMDVWFENEREGIIVGSFGMILRTTDGGKSWQPLLDRIENSEGFHLYGITRCGGDLFIAGEHGLLFRSQNSGRTWETLASPYEGTFFGIVGPPEGGFVAAFGLRGSLYYSQDRGQTWLLANSGTEASISGAMFFHDGSLFIVCVDGSILESSDKAKSFKALASQFPGSVSLTGSQDGALIVVGLKGVSRIGNVVNLCPGK